MNRLLRSRQFDLAMRPLALQIAAYWKLRGEGVPPELASWAVGL